MIVVVYGYGDFDMRYVDSIWEGPSGNKFSDFGDDKTPENAIKELKAAGFLKVNYKDITFGGNY